jgi:hypothetical protein
VTATPQNASQELIVVFPGMTAILISCALRFRGSPASMCYGIVLACIFTGVGVPRAGAAYAPRSVGAFHNLVSM